MRASFSMAKRRPNSCLHHASKSIEGASSYFLLVETTRPIRASASPQNPSAKPSQLASVHLKFCQQLANRLREEIERGPKWLRRIEGDPARAKNLVVLYERDGGMAAA